MSINCRDFCGIIGRIEPYYKTTFLSHKYDKVRELFTWKFHADKITSLSRWHCAFKASLYLLQEKIRLCIHSKLSERYVGLGWKIYATSLIHIWASTNLILKSSQEFAILWAAKHAKDTHFKTISCRRRSEYRLVITEPEVTNCFSINFQVFTKKINTTLQKFTSEKNICKNFLSLFSLQNNLFT